MARPKQLSRRATNLLLQDSAWTRDDERSLALVTDVYRSARNEVLALWAWNGRSTLYEDIATFDEVAGDTSKVEWLSPFELIPENFVERVPSLIEPARQLLPERIHDYMVWLISRASRRRPGDELPQLHRSCRYSCSPAKSFAANSNAEVV